MKRANLWLQIYSIFIICGLLNLDESEMGLKRKEKKKGPHSLIPKKNDTVKKQTNKQTNENSVSTTCVTQMKQDNDSVP